VSVAEAELASGHRFKREGVKLVCRLCGARGTPEELKEMLRDTGFAECTKRNLANPSPQRGET